MELTFENHHLESQAAIFSFLDETSTEATTSFAFPSSEDHFSSFDFSQPQKQSHGNGGRRKSLLSVGVPGEEHSSGGHEHSHIDNFFFSLHDSDAQHVSHKEEEEEEEEENSSTSQNNHSHPRKNSFIFDSDTFQDETFVNSFFLQENGQTRRQSLDPQQMQQMEKEQEEHEKRLAEKGDLSQRLGMIAVPTPSVWTSAFARARNQQSEGFPDNEGSDRNPFALFDDHARFRRDSLSNNSAMPGFGSAHNLASNPTTTSTTTTSTTNASRIPERREQPYFPPPPGVDPNRLPFPPVFMASFSHRTRSDNIANPLSRKRPRPEETHEPKKKQDMRKRQSTGPVIEEKIPRRMSQAKLMEIVEGFFEEPKKKVLSGKTNRSPVNPHCLRVQVGYLGEEHLKKYSMTGSIHGYHKLTKTKTESLGVLQKISFSSQNESLNWRKEEGAVFVTFRSMIVKHSSHNHGQKLFIRFTLLDAEENAIDQVDTADFSTITRRGVEKQRQKKTKAKMAKIELLQKGISVPNVTSSDPGFIFADAPQMIKLYGTHFDTLRTDGLKIFFGDEQAHDIFSVRADMILLEIGPLRQGTVDICIEQDGKTFTSDHKLPVLPPNPQHLSPGGFVPPQGVPLSNGPIANHNAIHSLSSTLSPKNGVVDHFGSTSPNSSTTMNGGPPPPSFGSKSSQGSSSYFQSHYGQAADNDSSGAENQNPNGNGVVRHDSVQYRAMIK